MSGASTRARFRYAPEPAEVADLVDRARNTFLSGGARHSVLIDLPPDLPRAMADRRRIVQVLNNLFSNASRHAPESLPIRVTAVREGVYIAISVADQGRGATPERLPHCSASTPASPAATAMARSARPASAWRSARGWCRPMAGASGPPAAGPARALKFTFTLPVAEAPGAVAPASIGPDRPPAAPRSPKPTRILVLDDDPQTLRYVRGALAGSGYAAIVTGDPTELPRLIHSERPELVLLDLVLPGVDGIELMKRVPELADLPAIFISGYGRDQTIAQALEAGAVDYIVKPFSPTELTARIRAALRKRAEPEPFVLNDLAIHYEQRRVSVAGRAVHLTATEYELLRVLSLNAGRVSTYDALLRQVWGGRHDGDTELVRTFVKNLRRKLGDDAANPAYIVNERRVGYRMVRPGDA